ncbi:MULTISPECIES: hypothetical protein [Nocardia]|uniref:hypothetical protein n=1 Tax=Nocardia TaxID=1817 RepID=UPI0007A3E26B|nr:MULTISPECIES: hypothetical protein [Nocardia]
MKQLKRLWRTWRHIRNMQIPAGGQVKPTPHPPRSRLVVLHADESSVAALNIGSVTINPNVTVTATRSDGSTTTRRLGPDGYWHDIGPTNENWMGVESLMKKDEP